MYVHIKVNIKNFIALIYLSYSHCDDDISSGDIYSFIMKDFCGWI